MSKAEQQLRDLLRAAAPRPGQLDFEGVVRRVARRRRSRMISGIGAAAALTTAAIVVPLAFIGGANSPGVSTVGGHKVIRGEPLKATIVIDDDETFAPPPSYFHATLTARQAFDAYAHRAEPIPSTISYQLGILTSPPSITDVLVWGFSGPPGGCVTTGGVPRPGSTPRPSPSPPPRCIEWDFVSATTGRGVEGTWQQIGAPSPSPSPTPPAAIALQSGGFLDAEDQRYSPQDLVLQGPTSIISWTFDNANCTIALHWFLPPGTQTSPARTPCPWTHTFTTSIHTDFASRGHVFTVVAGYVPEREHYSVQATLADGATQFYDASDADGAWMFAVQRCGNIAGTAITTITEIRYRHGVPKPVPDPARYPPTSQTTIQKDCQDG